jgi:hypothetical protein
MENEAASCLDRAAPQYAYGFGARRQPDRIGFRHDVELRQKLAEIDLLGPVIDDDAHGAVVAMGAHVDDGACERTFAKRRHRDQELSFQTRRRWRIRLSHDRLLGSRLRQPVNAS